MEPTEVKETKKEEGALVTLKPFDIQKAQLQKLVDDYKNTVVTEETYESSKKVRATLRDERIHIQNILKENKSVLNDFKKKQEEMADELIAIISPTEEKIDAGIKAIEQKKEQEKKRKEEEAMKRLSERQSKLSGYEMKYDDGSYTLGDHTITAVQLKVFSDEEFNDFLELVKTEYQKILDLRLEAEAKKKEEEERLEKQRIEQEAEGKRLAEIAEAQKKREAELKAEQDRIAAEAQQKEAEAKREADEKQKKLDEERMAFLREKRDTRVYQLKEIGLNRNVAATGYLFETVFISDMEIDEMDAKEWSELIPSVKEKVSSLIELAESERIKKQEADELLIKQANERIRAREEALRPDREKIAAYMKSLVDLPVPEVGDEQAKLILLDVVEMIKGIEKHVEGKINNL